MDIFIVNNSGKDVYIEISRNDTRPVYNAVNALGPWRAKRDDPQHVWDKPVPEGTQHVDVYFFRCRNDCTSFWKESIEPRGRHILVVEGSRVRHEKDYYTPPKEFPSWVYFASACVMLLCLIAFIIYTVATYQARLRQSQQGGLHRGLRGGGQGTMTSRYYP